MLAGQPPERPPPHPFPLGPAPVEDTGFPAQTLPKPVRLPCGTVAGIFARAGVGQPMAVSAGEDPAAIQDRHAPAAAHSRADEPGARAAQVACGSVDGDPVFLVAPFAAGRLTTIAQDHEVGLRSHADRSHDSAAPPPRPDRTAARPEHSLARPSPHVDGEAFLRRGLGPVAPTVSAARTAHGLSRNHLANCIILNPACGP